MAGFPAVWISTSSGLILVVHAYMRLSAFGLTAVQLLPDSVPNLLLQAYVAKARVESFSLVADLMYVAQNAPRICRALFEITLRRGWPQAAELTLSFCKVWCLLTRTHDTASSQGLLLATSAGNSVV